MSSGNYYVPASSKWPILMSLAIFTFMLGFVFLLHDVTSVLMYLGLATVLYFTFRWFKDVIAESIDGKFKPLESASFKMGMGWFIFSEVTFFATFFGSLYYVRAFVLPWLGGDGDGALTNDFLWSSFVEHWPLISYPAEATLLGSGGDIFSAPKELVDAWGIPALNTLILLTSGVTITLAHYALLAGKRKELSLQLGLTVLLGIIFLGFQVYEYIHAYSLGLTLKSGIYGSLFYMLTGFHGFHVLLGATILTFVWIRVQKGHFSADNHFAFSVAAWYWHFVDVVWLGLFVVVYWL